MDTNKIVVGTLCASLALLTHRHYALVKTSKRLLVAHMRLVGVIGEHERIIIDNIFEDIVRNYDS